MLSSYYVSGTIPGTGEAVVSKTARNYPQEAHSQHLLSFPHV